MDVFGTVGATLEWARSSFAIEALTAVLPREWIADAIAESGRQSKRVRSLPAPVATWIVILFGIFRDLGNQNLLEKLRDCWFGSALWPNGKPSSPAVTQARDRLGVEPLRRLFTQSAAMWTADNTGYLFFGRRVCAMDGSTGKVPDSDANREYFGLPAASRGRAAYPQGRTVSLLDIGTRIITGVRCGPYNDTSELRLATQLLTDVRVGSLVLLDRLYAATPFLWDLAHVQLADFVVRLPKTWKPRVYEVLGDGDVLVLVQLSSKARRARPSASRFWMLRMITYRPEGAKDEIRLLTTILDRQVPALEIARLYHVRWEHEGAFDELKTHLGHCATVNRPVLFRSKTPTRVEQELYGLLIAYNVVRRLMVDAARTANVSPERLSFVAALERIREAVRDMALFPTRKLPDLYAKLLEAIARARIPERPGRKYPRAVKIKMSKYPLKRVPKAA